VARPKARLSECGRRVSGTSSDRAELDEFLHFVLSFLDSSDVTEGDLIFVTGKHARFRFTEFSAPLPAHADLLAEQEIENGRKERDGEKN
jgi:hypothetical protein